MIPTQVYLAQDVNLANLSKRQGDIPLQQNADPCADLLRLYLDPDDPMMAREAVMVHHSTWSAHCIQIRSPDASLTLRETSKCCHGIFDDGMTVMPATSSIQQEHPGIVQLHGLPFVLLGRQGECDVCGREMMNRAFNCVRVVPNIRALEAAHWSERNIRAIHNSSVYLDNIALSVADKLCCHRCTRPKFKMKFICG